MIIEKNIFLIQSAIKIEQPVEPANSGEKLTMPDLF